MKNLVLILALFVSTNVFAEDFGCFFSEKSLKSGIADTLVTRELKKYCGVEKPFSVAAAHSDSNYRSEKRIMICCHTLPDVEVADLQ